MDSINPTVRQAKMLLTVMSFLPSMRGRKCSGSDVNFVSSEHESSYVDFTLTYTDEFTNLLQKLLLIVLVG